MQRHGNSQDRLTSPIVSITGIDGSGKSTVAREAHLGVSKAQDGFAGLEVDRQIHLINDGNVIPIFDDRYDGIASKIDGSNKLIQTYNRARYARAKAQLGRRASDIAERPLDMLVNVRDPVLDSYVFASDRLSALSPNLSLNMLRHVSGARWPDTTIWLDVDPEEALSRIKADAEDRTKYGVQAHENPETLNRMRGSYMQAMNAMRHVSDGRVVRIDGSQPVENVIADVKNVLSDSLKKPR